jgi:uncharacterized protein YkwD
MRIRLTGRRSLGRLAAAIGSLSIAAVGLAALSAPPPTIATRPGIPIPVGSVATRTEFQAGMAWDAPISIAFSTPMNAASVASSLRVDPATAVDLAWSADGTTLLVSPRSGWRPGTVHTLTVGPGTLAANGSPMTAPVRAAFETRTARPAVISPTKLAGAMVSVDSSFELLFDRDVSRAGLRYTVQVDPAVAGTVQRVARRSGVSFYFVPDSPLLPGTTYRLSLVPSGLDADASIAQTASVTIRTAVIPSVLRLRPLDKSTAVGRRATLSVRFSEPMDQAATKAALSVTAGGRAVAGTILFIEGGTVLVFRPSAMLGAGQQVVMTVSTAARSSVGVPLATPVSTTFTTFSTAAGGPRVSTDPGAAPPPPGGSVGGGAWAAMEEYYLTLMNCTRTGGWLTATGSCSSPGGRAVAPLWIDAGISDNVSRPYAKLLATRGICNHFIGGTPGDRLRRAGYTSWTWAENLGCPSMSPRAAMIAIQVFFQSEKSYGGGHYVNLMNPAYDRVGLGMWVSSGRVRLVIDFYHPR